jgi:MFS family permease
VVNIGTASLGVFLFGFHLAVINASLSQMSASLGGLSLQQQGSIVSTALLGAAVGSFAGGWFADVLGRVRAFALSGCTLALGGFLCATCTSLPTLLAGRSLCGVGIGVASSVVPIFLTEVSPPGAAGLVGSANQLTINLGILFALVIGALTAQTPEGWRNAFWFSCFPALLFASSPFLLREPQPQPTQSEQQPAQQEQQQHGGHENGPIDPEAKQQPQEEQPSEEQQSSWMDLLFGWPGRLALCVSIFCLQQLAGVVRFLREASFPMADSRSCTCM